MRPGAMSSHITRWLSGAVVCLSMLSVSTAAALDLAMVAVSAEGLAKPHDIVLSPDGVHLFVADNENNRIAVIEAIPPQAPCS